LFDLPTRFLEWSKGAKWEAKSKAYYRDGWRMLSGTQPVGMRLDKIAAEDIDKLTFSGAPANTNCALRTLRRMLHKAEEWKLLRHPAKVNCSRNMAGRSSWTMKRKKSFSGR
jgi:hypothetical protein